MKMLWKLIEVIKDCDSKGRYTSTVARFAKKTTRNSEFSGAELTS